MLTILLKTIVNNNNNTLAKVLPIPITPARSIRDLGIYIDADLSMREHVKRTVSRCFAALRQLRQIGRAVPTATFQMLVVALVMDLYILASI